MARNESKTKTMLILVAGKHLHKKMSRTSLTIHVNSVELKQVQSQKLLGVIIDTQLISVKKLTQPIAVLKKIRRYLMVMYGSSGFPHLLIYNLNKVFRLRERAVFLNADTRANSVDLFRELNWLPFFHEAI